MKIEAVTEILMALLLASMSMTAFNLIPSGFAGISEDGTFWTSDDPPLSYPPLPSGTYDIIYDTELEANWGPMLIVWDDFQQHLRVRFTSQAKGQLVREARIAWAGEWGGENTFEIRLVDADTGFTKTTPVITEPDPWDWKVYDVSSLAFYTDGDFYIEFWAIGAIIGVYTDDTPPIYGRSEVNRGTGWFYPTDWMPSDFKIRAVVDTAVTEALSTTVDVEPNRLNLKKERNGWITAYISPPEGYTTADIAVETIELEIQGVSFPMEWYDIKPPKNSIFIAKFDKGDVVNYLRTIFPSNGRGFIEFKITGKLADDTPFEGTNIIQLIF